jgi:hypothetical protein
MDFYFYFCFIKVTDRSKRDFLEVSIQINVIHFLDKIDSILFPQK